jgi:hypothetical protein
MPEGESAAEVVYRELGNKNNKSHYKTNYILKTNGLSLNYYQIMNRFTLTNCWGSPSEHALNPLAPSFTFKF